MNRLILVTALAAVALLVFVVIDLIQRGYISFA